MRARIGRRSAQECATINGVAIPIHTFTMVAPKLNPLGNLGLDEVAASADKLKRLEDKILDCSSCR
jgi:hypothetical protein